MTIKATLLSLTLSLLASSLIASKDRFFLRTTLNKDQINLPVKALQQKYPQNKRELSKLKPQALKLKTPKGITFSANFYDHGSDTIIVLGQGFRGDKRAMDYFVKAFGCSYDMITFDYRWKNFASYCLKPKTLINPLEQLVLVTQEEIKSVVNFVKTRKNYKDVVCLGLCYSGFSFLMAQADAEKKGSSLFSKMIIDSCWYSLDGFLESIRQDPMLPVSPQSGGTSGLVKTLLSHSPAYHLLFRSLKNCVPSICIKDYASKIYSPAIFFIHGADDKLVPLEYFDQMLSATKAPRVGLITPYQHADNFLNPELYTILCDLFIQSRRIEDFIQWCLEPNQLH